jgi:uncharacterized membrane protein
MAQKNIALSKTNLIICGIAVLLIIAGFLLMTGPSTTLEKGFEPDIFSARRIKLAPIVTVVGFALMIVGILYPTKEKKSDKVK